MKFAIRVEEILARTVIVESADIEDALEKLDEACNSENFLLDGVEDFFERKIFPSDRYENGIVPEGADVSFYEHLK